MLKVLEQLQFPVGALGQDGCAEGLHDLLDRDRLPSELILCRTVLRMSIPSLLATAILLH